MLTWLSRTDFDFPPLDKALQEPNGLLAAGGDLNPQRLVAAYRHGCFPGTRMASRSSGGRPTRAPSCSRRTARFPQPGQCLRQQRFEVTFNRDFRAVIQACAAPRNYADGTWITTPMQLAYQELHLRGIAHPWKSGRSDNWSAASTAWPWAGCSSANRCSAAPTTLPRSASSRWSAICATPASSSSTARCRPATCTAWAPAPSAGEFADYLQRYRDQPPTGDLDF